MDKKNSPKGISGKIDCKAMITKAAWYWHKYAHIQQWNGIKDTETSSYNYRHRTLDRGPKVPVRGKTAPGQVKLEELEIHAENLEKSILISHPVQRSI